MASSALKQTRMLVADLFVAKPWIYWTDLLLCLAIGYPAAVIMSQGQALPWYVRVACWPIAVVAIYRGSIFMHEISHFRHGEMKAFKVGWNILAGIPMFLPSYFYETHREHHNTRHYGTEGDGEYLPFAHGSWSDLLKYFAQVLYLPILTFVRHLIITPVSLLHPRIRQWVLEHWSSFVINFKFKREIRESDPKGWWLAMEIACHLNALAIVVAIATGFRPWYLLALIYSIAVGVLTLNHIRTLAAHRYRSNGETMSIDDQLLDSVDIASSNPLTLAICPVGLRYHALHHLFPGMPYHNLHKAHLRLMAELPESHPYRNSVFPSIRSVLQDLMRTMSDNQLGASIHPHPATFDTEKREGLRDDNKLISA